ncbi:DUF421 domain-containing protein [Bacillus sp. BRMEA1]|uniref:DUF421 domain-containing protein n=1 Tax=Neobacillus endophyticus TaxID=2738405 RepID=UPI0015637BE1|nr:DUF421 domain-containing protein [Neobacillus endophyticus]NRD77805.1 DUF421 domain-containing protein [Neobacillus endophyticus]
MDWSLIWKSLLLVMVGIMILRTTGRKSISQMTIPQTVVIVSMGTIIVTPIVGKGIFNTILTGVIFAAVTFSLEYLQLKFNVVEKLLTGKSILIIENGSLNIQNLKKLRMTVDQLEMRLRNEGIAKIEDVKTATIEPNGLLGYELQNNAKPVTAGELKQILDLYFTAPKAAEIHPEPQLGNTGQNIFSELNSPGTPKHPEYLQ